MLDFPPGGALTLTEVWALDCYNSFKDDRKQIFTSVVLLEVFCCCAGLATAAGVGAGVGAGAYNSKS
jgi:hypothetical protein